MTDFFYWLGDVFGSFFSLFEKLENYPNYVFVVVGFVGLFIWLNMQKNYNKKAEQEGSLK